jgi:hypothetical protein
MPAGTISPCQLSNLHRGACEARAEHQRTPALAVAPTSAYLWLAQVVAHGQASQSAALSGHIDARRDDFAVPTVKSAQGRVRSTRRAPTHAYARRCTHHGLTLARSGGCAWPGGAVGGPLRAHRRPQGQFHSANCQICTGALMKHAQSINARLRSPLHPPGLASGFHRWLRMVRRRSRRPFPGASTPAGAISPCQLPNLHRGACEACAEHQRTSSLAVEPTSAYLWFIQVVAHGQVAQSAALSGRIDARRDDFAVPTAKIAENR